MCGELNKSPDVKRRLSRWITQSGSFSTAVVLFWWMRVRRRRTGIYLYQGYAINLHYGITSLLLFRFGLGWNWTRFQLIFGQTSITRLHVENGGGWMAIKMVQQIVHELLATLGGPLIFRTTTVYHHHLHQIERGNGVPQQLKIDSRPFNGKIRIFPSIFPNSSPTTRSIACLAVPLPCVNPVQEWSFIGFKLIPDKYRDTRYRH